MGITKKSRQNRSPDHGLVGIKKATDLKDR
jgi:hypothetical protein